MTVLEWKYTKRDYRSATVVLRARRQTARQGAASKRDHATARKEHTAG